MHAMSGAARTCLVRTCATHFIRSGRPLNDSRLVEVTSSLHGSMFLRTLCHRVSKRNRVCVKAWTSWILPTWHSDKVPFKKHQLSGVWRSEVLVSCFASLFAVLLRYALILLAYDYEATVAQTWSQFQRMTFTSRLHSRHCINVTSHAWYGSRCSKKV